jgi:ribosome-associated heat shock protein Hsp15
MSRRDDTPAEKHGMRLDKWLWVARFFKTRSLAAQDIDRGRVLVNTQPAKPAREVRVGDAISLRQPGVPTPRVVQVLGLAAMRGPASVAQQLFSESAESIAAREQFLAQRSMEPAQTIEGRPTKRHQRQLAEWQRWSARVGDDTD